MTDFVRGLRDGYRIATTQFERSESYTRGLTAGYKLAGRIVLMFGADMLDAFKPGGE